MSLMPPEMQTWIGLGNVLTIIGFFLTIGAQTFLFWRWLSQELKSRDTALVLATADFSKQIARVDRDVSTMREGFSVQLAKIPTREAMDGILQTRIGPLEAEVRALTLELARNGMQTPTRV
ncbi:MAG: hypothetical protein ACREPX_01715 [Rhodanobacteraceae bacterium]